MNLRTSTIERLRDALLTSGRRKGAFTSSADRVLFREGLLGEKEQEAIKRVDPLAETMFLVMAADEQITDTEVAALLGAIRGLVGDVLSAEMVQLMIESYALRLQNEGQEKRLEAIACALKDPGEAVNAFALAAALALADDEIDSEESAILSRLKSLFALDEEEVAAVLGELRQDKAC